MQREHKICVIFLLKRILFEYFFSIVLDRGGAVLSRFNHTLFELPDLGVFGLFVFYSTNVFVFSGRMTKPTCSLMTTDIRRWLRSKGRSAALSKS